METTTKKGQDLEGAFIWRDLMTRDPQAAQSFYEELFGWGTQVAEGDWGSYTMWTRGTAERPGPFGGVVKLEGPEGEAVPSHWMNYVAVGDLDAALSQVEAKGGTICVPATPIPGVGRFAVIDDPTGGTVSLMERDEEQDSPVGLHGAEAGEFCWCEMMTGQPEQARDFYDAILQNWAFESHEMGPMGTYHMIQRQVEGDQGQGGIMAMPAEQQAQGVRSHWLPYVAVSSVEATFERAQELGASALAPPFDVGDFGRAAILADPTGAAFAVYTSVPCEQS